MLRSKSLRERILFSVGALVIISLLGSLYSLFRITEVNQTLDAINQTSVPLGRLLAQLKTDTEILKREMERKLGYAHWKDPHWRPQPLPRWIGELLEHEVQKASVLVEKMDEDRWSRWVSDLDRGLTQIKSQASKLFHALEQGDYDSAANLYPRWVATLQDWERRVRWGVAESDRSLRQRFTEAEAQVAGLRTGLQVILVVIVALSLMFLWLGERALRPLGDLTRLARQIAERGLRKEDKGELPEISLSRNDEVSQLAQEFRGMATTLLEREKTVESQKRRLEDQNRLLKEMGDFNQNILDSIETILIVTNLKGEITQFNPAATSWLGKEDPKRLPKGSAVQTWKSLQILSAHFPLKANWEGIRIEPTQFNDGRIYGGHLMPLRSESRKTFGSILVLEDLTDQVDLEDRLRLMEHLAAMGRMSAQVAHEIRNPLHSIGLEAELAMDQASQLGDRTLKQSAQSILSAVDRLEKITENYLRLSRPSSGKRKHVDLATMLQNVLATYTTECQKQGVEIDWSTESGSDLEILGDPELIEQVIGNLLRNALQAVEGRKKPKIEFRMGTAESGRRWLRIRDNGPGISPEIRDKLFSPFVTTKAQGTGLGLSFIKKVLEDHGGDIRWVPEAEKGAVFEVTFPLVERKEVDEKGAHPIS